MTDTITFEQAGQLTAVLQIADSLLAQGYSKRAIVHACAQAATLIRQQDDHITALVHDIERAQDALSKMVMENQQLRQTLQDIACGKYARQILPTYPPKDPAMEAAKQALC